MFFSQNQASSTLLFAAFNGSKEIAELLISYGASVQVCDDKGYTPLHIAAQKGRKDIVELLIANGAQVNAITADGCTPLYMTASGNQEYMAVSDNHQDIAQLLLHHGAVMESEIAVLLGDVKLVKQYLEQGISANSQLEKGFHKRESWLITAVTINNKELTELLINYGANVNESLEVHQVSPLHRASALGFLEICQLLITYGADVNAKDKYGKTPLHVAVQYRHQNVVEFLLRCGADINALDLGQMSPLLSAVKGNRQQIVKILLSHQADVNLKDNLGDSSLSLACQDSRRNEIAQLELAKLLVNHGADVNARDNRGYSPLHKAVIGKNKEMVEFLLSHGALV